MNPKIVVTDYAFPELSIEQAVLADCDLTGRQCKTEADLIDLCKDADAVITQFARVNANVIAGMPRAKVIVRYGIGVDNVDLEAARARGIPVCNVPDYCVDEVSDHTLAFMLALTRQVVTHTNHLQSGKWGLVGPLTNLKALAQLTVGVIGFGRIGREVVRRLVPFKCAIRVFDPLVPAEQIRKAGVEPASFDEVLKTADLLTLHCPSTPQTRKIFNRDSLAKLKRGAILINVGRGDLVDVPALTAALQSGQLSGAALNVFDPEPIPAGHPVLKMPNVLLTPHIASASPTAVHKLRTAAAELALRAVRGQPLPNIVNGVPGRG